MEWLLLVVMIVGAIILLQAHNNKRRRERLLAKYGDPKIVDRIMNKQIWQGMTEDQLVDSWGRPAAKDEKVYKTKVTRTFKYNQEGKNRFRSRVRVENGHVVGWEQR